MADVTAFYGGKGMRTGGIRRESVSSILRAPPSREAGMNCLGRRLYKLSNAPISSGECNGRPIHCSLIALIAAASWLAAAGVAHSGPCTAQIAQIEQQVAGAPPGPETGPTGPQTLGSQLH